MLVYFKNEEIVEINVEPKETKEELLQNNEDLESIKTAKIYKLSYCCQWSIGIEEILLEDIDTEIIILKNPISSDVVSPSTEEVVKSSADARRSDIVEEITQRCLTRDIWACW